MDIRIFDRSLTLLYVCDCALRITASESFAAPGKCAITVPIAAASQFSREGIVALSGIGAGFVVDRIQKDAAAGTAEITGEGVLSYFSRRVLPGRQKIAGAAESVMLELARSYGTAVLSAPLSTVEYGFDEAAEVQFGGGSLLSAMDTVANAAGLGMRLSVTAGGFLFSVRRPAAGTIRLSREGGQIIGGVHLTDGGTYVNQVTVIGGDGRWVTVSAAGLFHDETDDKAEPLREMLYRASEITPTQYETDEKYLAALSAKGREVLAGRRPRRTAQMEITPAAAEKLTVGTLYEIEDSLFGITGTAQCLEKTMIQDESGIRWKASLG